MLLQTKVDEMAYFHDFTLFKENVYNRRLLYHQAVNSALREAAKRAGIGKVLTHLYLACSVLYFLQ